MKQGIGSRISFVGGLACFWPFLQGPYFSLFFGAQASNDSWAPLFAFNICALIFSIVIYIAYRHRPAAGRNWLLLPGLLCIVGGVLLGCIACGLGSSVFLWVAMPVVAAAFAASAGAWGERCRQRCLERSRADVLVEVALSYAGCYLLVFAVELAPGVVQPLLWAGCPLLSGVLLLLQWRCEGDLAMRDDPPAQTRLTWVLLGTVACLALVSAVLAGLYSNIPARSYGPSAACAVLLVACAAAARRRSGWNVAFWALALVPVLMSGFCVMAMSADLIGVGIDALTVGRRLVWVLYWWLLVGLLARHPGVMAAGFVPLYVATRLIIDGLRMGGIGSHVDPRVASAVTVTVAFVLVIASLAVVGLAVAREMGKRDSTVAQPAGDRPAPEAARAIACQSLAEELGLTERERDVLGLVSMGYTVQRIAEERGVSQNTVRTHTKGLYRKLNIHTKQEAIELVNARMEGTA